MKSESTNSLYRAIVGSRHSVSDTVGGVRHCALHDEVPPDTERVQASDNSACASREVIVICPLSGKRCVRHWTTEPGRELVCVLDEGLDSATLNYCMLVRALACFIEEMM